MKFGDIVTPTSFPGRIVLMVLCPGTADGIHTDEGTRVGTEGWVGLVLNRGTFTGSDGIWPLHETASLEGWNPVLVDEKPDR